MAESFSEEGWQKCCCGRSRLLLGSRLNSTGYICSCLGMTKEKLLFYLVGHKSGKVMEHDSNRTHISDTTTSSKPGAQSAYLVITFILQSSFLLLTVLLSFSQRVFQDKFIRVCNRTLVRRTKQNTLQGLQGDQVWTEEIRDRQTSSTYLQCSAVIKMNLQILVCYVHCVSLFLTGTPRVCVCVP
eukprot:c17424_g1_i4 orf=220-774(+)